MVFLSNLQVTAYWITNLSLNLSSFLFRTPLLDSALPFNSEISNIGSVKKFIHWTTIIPNWIEIEYETTVHTLTFSYSAPSTER